MEIQIENLSALTDAAKQFIDAALHRKTFVFKGDMGAGKTTFILALLKAMGVRDAQGSPTYSIVNTYESEMYGPIFHFDLYRLENEEEALDIGIEEMLYGEGICFVEWPEKISDLLPDNTIWSYIRRNEDNSRSITIDL